MSRISPGTLLLAAIAVIAGTMGAYIVKQKMKKPQVAIAPEKEPVETYVVPLASTDLQSGREISLGDIAILRMTRQEMIDQGISGPFMNNSQQIIGRVLRSDLAKGTPFETQCFYPEGTGPSVAELLGPGKRAITVPVEIDAAVAGFATPGTWVDVLFRSDAVGEGSQAAEVAMPLLERVKVLAINQETFEGSRVRGQRSSRSASVTLEVSPDEATTLRVVDGHGSLALALRHPDDNVTFTTHSPVTLDEVLSIPPAQSHEIEVFRGTRVSRVEFESKRSSPSYLTRVARDDVPAAGDALTSAPVSDTSDAAAAGDQ